MSGFFLRRIVLLALLSLLGVLWLSEPARAQARPKPPRGKKPAGAMRPRPVQGATPLDPPVVRRTVAEALALEASFKDSESLAKFQQVLKLNPGHYLSLWQAAVLSVRIGQRYSDETRKKAYFDAGRAYADRALALQPEGGESNYAVALALFNQATLRTARGRLAAFRDLRSHVYLATERRPDWAEAWQLLGRWQYRVAHYNVLERLFSRVVLGGVPPGASSRKAIESLGKAHRLDSLSLPICYDLARVYHYQGQRQNAVRLLQYAVRLAPATSEDLTVLRRCQQLLVPLERQLARTSRREE